ncbi:MAG: NAD-binding protein [Myxococcota bacterium]|nr:NAD-binding protein [Myxococcota bacterium]
MEKNTGPRVLRALAVVIFSLTVGTIGFWFLSDQVVTVGDCLYMTIITLSTVGYGEIIPMTGPTRFFASVLIVFGMGSLIYFGSTVIAFFIEFDLTQMRRRKRMQKNIKNLHDHVIVCGVGTTGAHVVTELIAAKTPFIMLESHEERIRELGEIAEVDGRDHPYIIGDATEDRLLEQAGLERAFGLVAALPSDKDNLYIILSARQANPKLRIVARATEKDAPPKMIHAGANRVVSPNFIGGLRIASEMIRPQVVEFLDMMLRDQTQNTRIEQIVLSEDSPLAGKRLAETNIRKATDVLVIAVRNQSGDYVYNPGPDTLIEAGATMVVLGSMNSIIRLRKSLSARSPTISLID